jgi:thioredoxin 1
MEGNKMALIHLDSKGFEERVYNKGENCLVVFSMKTCVYCKELIPILEELAPEYEGKFGFYHVDAEESIDLYRKFSLKGVPQTLFFSNGNYLGKFVGVVEEEDIREQIAEVLG